MISAFAIYYYHNMHWYYSYEKALASVGQLVIPKAVREKFGLSGGQRLIVLTDDAEGIALIPAEVFEDKLKNTWEYASKKIDDND